MHFSTSADWFDKWILVLWELNNLLKPLMTNVLSCRNQLIDLLSKSIDWFLYVRNIGR